MPDDQPPPAVRLLYAGIVLVRLDRRTWLDYTLLSMTRRGSRLIALERLRWKTLLIWLLRVGEETFRITDTSFTVRAVLQDLEV